MNTSRGKEGEGNALTHPWALSCFTASLKIPCFALQEIEHTSIHKAICRNSAGKH